MPTCCFIELASGTVRAGTVEGYAKRAKLVAYHEEKFIASDDDLPRILNSLFETLASRVRLSRQNVVISLSSRFLTFREVSFPFTDKKRVGRTLPFQIEENIALPVDEVVIDAFEISKTENSSTWYACCLPKKLMRAISEACENIDVDPSVIAPSFAGIPFVGQNAEMRLVIDIGHETTNLVLVNGNSLLFTRSLRLAGKTITNSLASTLSLEFAIAEETKNSSKGLEDSNSLVRDVVATELTRLVRDIKLTLSTLPADRAPKSVVVTGGGASLGGITSYLSEKLSIPCETINSEALYGPSKLIAKPGTAGFHGPFGLASAENAALKSCINFRTGEFAFHGIFDRIAVSLLIMLVLLSAILGLGVLFFHAQHADAQKSYNTALQKVEGWFKTTIPDQQPPSDLTKYKAFIDERLIKVAQEAEVFGRYYSRSVLPNLLSLSLILSGINYEFVNLEIGKNSMRVVLSIDEEDSNLLNDALQRSKQYFKDFSMNVSRKSEERVDYTVNFIFNDR